MTEHMAHFYINAIEHVGSAVRVEGAITFGEVRVGDHFSVAFRDIFEFVDGGEYQHVRRDNVRRIALSVRAITSYRHSLDELSEGMSGELVLAGDGCDVLTSSDTIAITEQVRRGGERE